MTSMKLASAKYFNAEASAAESPVKVEARNWTNSLTLICFLSISFGLWGMAFSAYQINGILSGTERIFASAKSVGSSHELAQAVELFERFRMPRTFVFATGFVMGILLIVAAAMLFGKANSARSTAVTIFGAVIGFHVCCAVLSCAMFISASSSIEEAGRSMAAPHISGERLDSAVSHYMGDVAFFALIVTFAVLLIKAAIYVCMILHLNTPYIRAVFGENPYPEYNEMRKKVEASKLRAHA